MFICKKNSNVYLVIIRGIIILSKQINTRGVPPRAVFIRLSLLACLQSGQSLKRTYSSFPVASDKVKVNSMSGFTPRIAVTKS